MKNIIKKIVLKLEKWCENHGRVQVIFGQNPQKSAYLVRYILFKSKYTSIYIHRFLRSDDDSPHDHPWPFLTYVVTGGYYEYLYDTSVSKHENNQYTSYWNYKYDFRYPGSIAFRKPTDIHRVFVMEEYSIIERHKAPLTICLIGPRIRRWGFWDLSENGAVWIDWRKYLKKTPLEVKNESE